LRRRLVHHLRRRGYLTDRRLADAFLAVPREVFLPEHTRRLGLEAIYRDEAIVVRRDPRSGAPRSSSSQPAIMALMLQMLDPGPGDRVLEIGAGTGYNAALLGHLTRPGGRVVTVDIAEDVAAGAAAAVRRLGGEAEVIVADGRIGLPGPHQFDCIEVTASSAEVPQAWHDQLAPGGRLVLPLRLSTSRESTHAVTAFAKSASGFDSIGITCGGFMPLRSPSADPVDPTGGGWRSASAAFEVPEVPDVPEGPDPAEPEESSGDQPDAALGPPLSISREEVAALRIAVRYDRAPTGARWVFERSDHWIGVDLG
jgi:protein-L-isoaspartate(D-aspartate) O-methyltransferase